MNILYYFYTKLTIKYIFPAKNFLKIRSIIWMRKTSEETIQNILYWHAKGKSNVENARKNGISEKTVRNILKSRKPGAMINCKAGRPQALTDRESTALIRAYGNSSLHTTTDGKKFAKIAFDKDISEALIRKILKNAGFKNYKKQKAPLLSKANLKKRKNFYEKHKNNNFQDYKKNNLFR